MSRPLTLDRDTHVYTVDGTHAAGLSVTQVLHQAGLIDFSMVPPFVLERARRRGAAVHQAIHFYNDRDLDLESFARDWPDCVGYVDAWVAFCTQRAFTPVLNEHPVYSDRLDVAGTIDCLGLLDGQAVLLDFATGRPDDVAKDLQTAGYLALALEWQGDDVPLAAFLSAHPSVRRFAVALHPFGTFTLEAYPDPRDLRQFQILCEAQRIVAARRPHREVPV